MPVLKRSLFFLALLVAMGCHAQTPVSPDLTRKIEAQVRANYQLPPYVQINVGQRKTSPDFAGYDEVVITLSAGEKKQDILFLLSKDNKTLVRATKMDLTKDLEAEARKHAQEVMAKIDTAGRPFRGNANAKVTIVNYDDFQCPFCADMHQALMHDIMPAYKDRVKLVYKDFPLTQIHPWAAHAAINSNCLAAQGGDAFWNFANYIHNHRDEIGPRGTPLQQQFEALDRIALEQGKNANLDTAKLQACVSRQDDSALRASMKEANELDVEATPTLFINGVKVDGAVPAPQLRKMIDDALQDQNGSAVAGKGAQNDSK